jgi:hypothetical protein
MCGISKFLLAEYKKNIRMEGESQPSIRIFLNWFNFQKSFLLEVVVFLAFYFI